MWEVRRMNAFLIILIMLAIFAGGYCIMDKIDHVLSSSFHGEPSKYQQRPSCMMLPDSLSDEELIRTIRHFSAQHGHSIMILRGSLPDDGGNDT